ncbi:MAG: hypothetical protein RJA70_4250, partial [Pseudomonadota bacterium]
MLRFTQGLGPIEMKYLALIVLVGFGVLGCASEGAQAPGPGGEPMGSQPPSGSTLPMDPPTAGGQTGTAPPNPVGTEPTQAMPPSLPTGMPPVVDMTPEEPVQACIPVEIPRLAPDGKPWNILMLPVDDLNTWTGHLGDPNSKTPNIDRLAARGVSFRHAYTASPHCNSSRAALLSGRYPHETGVYEGLVDGNVAYQGRASLPAHLKANGYKTMGVGKVFHTTPSG